MIPLPPNRGWVTLAHTKSKQNPPALPAPSEPILSSMIDIAYCSSRRQHVPNQHPNVFYPTYGNVVLMSSTNDAPNGFLHAAAEISVLLYINVAAVILISVSSLISFKACDLMWSESNHQCRYTREQDRNFFYVVGVFSSTRTD